LPRHIKADRNEFAKLANSSDIKIKDTQVTGLGGRAPWFLITRLIL